MCGSMVDIQCSTAENRRGQEKEEEDRKPQLQNIMSASATLTSTADVVIVLNSVSNKMTTGNYF